MVCDGLSSPKGCRDGDLGSTPCLGKQQREAWSISHQLLWIQVKCTIMLHALQFASSTFFPLERTCKYTQPCTIYHWGQTQFHHSSTLEWLLVGSDGGRLELGWNNHSYLERKFFLIIIMWVYCCFANLFDVFVIWHAGYHQSHICLLFILDITVHVINLVEHLPGEPRITFISPILA